MPPRSTNPFDDLGVVPVVDTPPKSKPVGSSQVVGSATTNHNQNNHAGNATVKTSTTNGSSCSSSSLSSASSSQHSTAMAAAPAAAALPPVAQGAVVGPSSSEGAKAPAVDEAARKQQAQIQLQVVGLGGVGVLPCADNLSEEDRARAELTARELEQRQKGNAETCQRVVSTLQKKFTEIDRESKKLAFVKTELAKLDQSLSTNISVLRTEIEKVGREEADAQADFDAKEKAYLISRKNLAKKKQRKQLLIAHLDHIILNNERQKADKLRELEQHLEVNEDKVSVVTHQPAEPSVTFRGFTT